jgi:hypothetical protein
VPSSPVGDLRLDNLALDGGEQRLAVREREADVLGPLGRLLEHGHLLGRAGSAVIGGDLEQDADAHGAPPIAVPGPGG